ncbi:hypothetical protein A2U01_0102215, partial [Trifolium medium]|nr:hypothetical protein [Trifolium medium]
MAENSGALSLLTGTTRHSCLRDVQLTEAFQPSGSDLAQRASTPCAPARCANTRGFPNLQQLTGATRSSPLRNA